MTTANSTRPNRPNKPYPDFPLTPHPTGRWCKKIRGKLHYFAIEVSSAFDADFVEQFPGLFRQRVVASLFRPCVTLRRHEHQLGMIRGFRRHTFQTIGDEARDFVAVRKIMGHVSSDIADEYRECISDDRLRAVAEHVRGWLFAPAAKSKIAGKTEPPSKAPITNQNPNLRLFTA